MVLGTLDCGDFELQVNRVATGRDFVRGMELQEQRKVSLSTFLAQECCFRDGQKVPANEILEWESGIVDAVSEVVLDGIWELMRHPDDNPRKYPQRYFLGRTEVLDELRSQGFAKEEGSEAIEIKLLDFRKVKHDQEVQKLQQPAATIPFFLLSMLCEFDGERLDFDALCDRFTFGQVQAMLPLVAPKKPVFKPVAPTPKSTPLATS